MLKKVDELGLNSAPPGHGSAFKIHRNLRTFPRPHCYHRVQPLSHLTWTVVAASVLASLITSLPPPATLSSVLSPAAPEMLSPSSA